MSLQISDHHRGIVRGRFSILLIEKIARELFTAPDRRSVIGRHISRLCRGEGCIGREYVENRFQFLSGGRGQRRRICCPLFRPSRQGWRRSLLRFLLCTLCILCSTRSALALLPGHHPLWGNGCYGWAGRGNACLKQVWNALAAISQRNILGNHSGREGKFQTLLSRHALHTLQTRFRRHGRGVGQRQGCHSSGAGREGLWLLHSRPFFLGQSRVRRL